ncbi:MAG: InlB B-repeat-containing protein, partial [Firmicutes bacterium]|nr:InlB B-repeat-containing protein [Bacillota bacterium]
KYKDKHIGRGNFDIIHDTPFKGTFDGGNNTIEGLDINIIIDEDIDVRVFNTGLFGKLAENGSIKDLTISGATISGDSYIGAVAGAIENGVIENVNTSDCSITARRGRAGGIAGFSPGFASISNCNVSGLNISAAYGEVGGIIGRVQGKGNVISSCTVSDSQVETDGEMAGGIVGDAYEHFRTDDELEISRCSFNGTVSAKKLAGGIAGRFLPPIEPGISECFVDAEITAERSAGGIAGDATNIVNCYSKGEVTATGFWGGGIIGEGGSVKSSYSTILVNNKQHAGGIIGDASTPAHQIVDCLALNPSVATEESEYAYYNRVFPVYETISGNGEFVRNAATGQRNYAYSDMRLSGGGKLIYCPVKERKLSGGDGEDVTYEELADESELFVLFDYWDGSVWNLEAGKLPTLKNLPQSVNQSAELPDYFSNEIDWTIKTFADLEFDNIEVDNGTAQENIGLPDKLDVTLTDDNAALIPVTWSAEGGYAPDSPGAYNFTAVLPDDCAPVEGVSLPVIVVNVRNNYVVAFDTNGATAIDNVIVDFGASVAEPAEPERRDFIFEGWYKAEDYAEKWDFVTDTVTSSATLYAKWRIADDAVTYTAAQSGNQSMDVTGKNFFNTFILRISDVGGYTTHAVVDNQKIDFYVPVGEYVIALQYDFFDASTKMIGGFDQNAGHTPQEKSYKGNGTAEEPYTMLGTFYAQDGSKISGAHDVKYIDTTFRVLNLIAGYDTEGTKDYGMPYSVKVEDRNVYGYQEDPPGPASGRLNASFTIDGSRLLPCHWDGWFRSPRAYGVVLNPSDAVIGFSFDGTPGPRGMYTHVLYNNDYAERRPAAIEKLQAVRADDKSVLMLHTQTRDFPGPMTYKLDVSGYFGEGDTVNINYLLGAANGTLYHGITVENDYMLAMEPTYIKNNTSAVVTNGFITFDLRNGGYFELVRPEDDDKETKYVAEFAPEVADLIYPGTIHPQILSAENQYKVTRPENPAKEGHTFDGWYSDKGLTAKYNFAAPLSQNVILYPKWTKQSGGGTEPGEPTYTVTFETGKDPDTGGWNASIDPQEVVSGETAEDPGFFDSGYGYLVLGWYTDSELTDKYHFGDGVTSDLTLYPNWMRYILKNDLKKEGGSGSEENPYLAHLADSRQSKIAWKALNELAGKSQWWEVYVTDDNDPDGDVRYKWVFNAKDIKKRNIAQPYYTDVDLFKESSNSVLAEFVWRTAIAGKVYVSLDVSRYFKDDTNISITYVEGSCDGKIVHTDVESGEWVDSRNHPSTYYTTGTAKVDDGFITLELTHGGSYLLTSGQGGDSEIVIDPETGNSVNIAPEVEAKDGMAAFAVDDAVIASAIEASIEVDSDLIV